MDELKEVKGRLAWSVHVECPHCEEYFDIHELVLPDDSEMLTSRVFGSSVDDYPNWDGPEIKYECPNCDQGFTLGRIEY